MTSADVVSADSAHGPIGDPQPLLRAGLGATALGFAVFQLPQLGYSWFGWDWGTFALGDGFWTFLRVLLLVGGAILAGGAVALAPRSPRRLLVAAFVAWLAGAGMDLDWDSARTVLLILATVAILAAFLLGLPFLVGKLYVGWYFLFPGTSPRSADAAERGRFAGWVLSRVIVSLLVMLHFLGIVACVLSTPPPGRDGSWLASWVWNKWQPYMQFCYLNNAYRFYSPEPGPPNLLWFYVLYADDSGQWVQLPLREKHDKDPLGQEFTRRLSLGESAGQSAPLTSVPEDVRQRRIAAATDRKYGIPKHPESPLEMQYRPPTFYSQRMLAEYARHVAATAPDASVPVRSVKVYRVVHEMLEPAHMASGKLSPTAEWTYLPYYMGEYTPAGELKDPTDPFLYWLIPRFAWPARLPPPNPLATTGPTDYLHAGELQVHDYLEYHAKLQLPQGGR